MLDPVLYFSEDSDFYVGENVEQTDIRAKFEDGILKVLVQRKKSNLP